MEAARRSVMAHPGIEAQFAEAGKPEDIEPAIARLGEHKVDSLIAMASPLFVFERRRIVELARARGWPVVSGRREWAEEGALLSYGADVLVHYRRAAWYVDRILKGAHPADLPVEQPINLELVVNLGTAKALGIAIPPSFLARADEVIE
jgi:putative tryptophan/tyrosine transport system substrate-binding protein